mmetsp:Transcript_16690/g.39633  ORF Transcript_16690/g.39633 Transcript_16690/m.39633 type:complete len:298 (-) Transcript_16690:149-1042(-)
MDCVLRHDEFLLIKDAERYPTIMDLLATISDDVDALSFNWELILMNNQTSYRPKPVTLRFRWKREKAMDPMVKTMVRSDRLKDDDTYLIHRIADYLRRQDTGGNVLHGALNERLPDGVAVLLHYYTKSLEEYKSRCKRGLSAFSRTCFPKLQDRSCKADSELLAELGGVDETVFDDAAWKFLQKNVPAYHKFEEDPTYVGHLPERWHIGNFASENKAATSELNITTSQQKEKKCEEDEKEATYLTCNIDVMKAVGAGTFESGWDHYIRYGQKEGRIWQCPFHRRDSDASSRKGRVWR